MAKRRARFVVFKDKKGQYSWHLKGANGEIMVRGASHPRRAHVTRAIHRFIELIVNADIQETEIVKSASRDSRDKREPYTRR